MGHKPQKGVETGGRAERETCKAQSITITEDDAHQHSVLECPHEPPGERLRCRCRVHLHGAVQAQAKSESLRQAPLQKL